MYENNSIIPQTLCMKNSIIPYAQILKKHNTVCFTYQQKKPIIPALCMKNFIKPYAQILKIV